MFDFKRMPRAEDVVDIGFWNLDGGAYQVVAQTRTYNWQQGSQLQWLPPDELPEPVPAQPLQVQFLVPPWQRVRASSSPPGE